MWRSSHVMRLSGGESLGDSALERELLLLQVLSRGILNLQLGHGIRESRLNLLLLATLETDGSGGVRDHLLDAGDVGLELLPGLELLAESLIAGLELLGVVDHVLDVSRRELANGVRDGDVGATARTLFRSRHFENAVNVNLKDYFEHSLSSPQRRYWCKGKLSQRGVVLAVDTLTLEDRELDGLLVVWKNFSTCSETSSGDCLTGNSGESPVGS